MLEVPSIMESSLHSTPASTPKKRKRPSYEMINDLVRSVGDKPDLETFKAAWMNLKGILESGDGNTTPKKQKVKQASKFPF